MNALVFFFAALAEVQVAVLSVLNLPRQGFPASMPLIFQSPVPLSLVVGIAVAVLSDVLSAPRFLVDSFSFVFHAEFQIGSWITFRLNFIMVSFFGRSEKMSRGNDVSMVN